MRSLCLLTFLIAGSVTSFAAENPGCVSFLECIPDKPFHAVQKKGGAYVTATSGQDAVEITTMYTSVRGRQTFDPADEFANAKLRKVQFYKGFLEFDESGQAFDPLQLEAILAKLSELKSTGPVYVVAYIHGWHNNAQTTESPTTNSVKFNHFLARFAELTRRLYEANHNVKVPTILGIFVGWRGETMPAWGVRMLTLGDRARAADRIGLHRGPSSLFEGLKQIADMARSTGPDAHMLVFGHSLGGRLLSRMLVPEVAKDNIYPFGKGVLAAAIEPAIGADCFDNIFSRKAKLKGSPGQVPSFVAVTSEDDTAIGKAYPYTRWIPYFGAEACDNSSGSKWQTIGNYAPYLTHHLDYEHFGDLQARKLPAPSPFKDDKTTLIYSVAGEQKDWLFRAGKILWFYPRYSLRDHSYDRRDGTLYTTDLSYKSASDRAGAVWNIQTDKELIGVREGKDFQSGLHNGYISTGLTHFLIYMTYFENEWAGGLQSFRPVWSADSKQ